MLKFFTTTILLTFFHFGSGQTRDITLEDLTFENLGLTDVYFVDNNNEMDFFEGSWEYANSSSTLTIRLKKESRVYNGRFYQDLLVGEYKYIENGVEIVNTLDQIDLRSGFNHSIVGNGIKRKCSNLPTSDCQDGRLKFDLLLRDPKNDKVSATLIIHKTNSNIIDTDAIIAYIIFKGPSTRQVGEVIEDPSLPWQKEYRMIRQ